MNRNHGTWRNLFGRGLRRTILAMGLAVVATVATAGTSAAAARLHQETCRGERGQYDICLLITDDPDPARSNHYLVRVGIDVFMAQRDAQNIVDDGAVISAVLWGSDPFADDYLEGITRMRVWVTDRGLSAEFERSVSGETLSEDEPDGDELYALVTLRFSATGLTRTFRSANVEDSFHG
jgi:hypothetical protein